MKDELYSQDLGDIVWQKSTFSNPHNCVEVGLLDGGIAVRDSKNPDKEALRFNSAEWRAFVRGAAAGEFS